MLNKDTLTKKHHWLFGAAGITSALFYIAAWIVGDILRPGFSMQTQAVSELIEAGAPNKLLLDIMIFGFHLLVIPFAYGLYQNINEGKGSKVGAILLASAGLLGMVLTLFFPCDPGCVADTFRGTMHIVLAIPLGFLILFAILAFSRHLRDAEQWTGYGTYSLVTFFVGLVMGVLAAAFAKGGMGGILERLVGIAYQQWYIVMGIALIRRSKPTASENPAKYLQSQSACS
jgi:hypothetical membrane protein